MEYLLLFFIGLLAFDVLLGFRESRARWREVASGRAGIFTLRMLTGLSDRQELTRRFGDPDSTFHYGVSSEKVRGARTTARQIFDQKWIESTLLGLAVMAGAFSILHHSTISAWVIVCAAFLHGACKAGYTMLVLARCYRQMWEEGRAKMRYIKAQAS